MCVAAYRELGPLKALSFGADQACWRISEIGNTFLEITFLSSQEASSEGAPLALHTGTS